MIGRVAKIITLVNFPITSGVFEIPRIYDERHDSGHFLHKAVQTSSGHMSHKLGVLGSHVHVQQVHLQ